MGLTTHFNVSLTFDNLNPQQKELITQIGQNILRALVNQVNTEGLAPDDCITTSIGVFSNDGLICCAEFVTL